MGHLWLYHDGLVNVNINKIYSTINIYLSKNKTFILYSKDT